MIFRDKSGRLALLRLLSISMAVLLCIMLVPTVSAEETTTNTVPVMESAAEVLEETETTEVAEVTEVTAETVHLNAVTEEEFLPVWNALIDPEFQKKHGEIVQKIKKDFSPYLYREVLEAMDKCREAVALQTELKNRINELLEKIEADICLGETARNHYIETLGIMQISLQNMDYRVTLFDSIATYPEQKIQIDEINNALEDMKKQNIQLDNLEDLLEITNSWKNLNDQLAEYAVEQDEQLVAIVEGAQKTAEALKSDIENFFSLNDPEKQAKLDEEIEELEQYVDALPIHRTILASPLVQEIQEQINKLQDQIQQMQGQIQQMQDEISDTSGKSVFVFIALGVSVLAVIMGITAAVCALKKTDGNDTENLQAAFRRDLESVSEQNGILRGRIDLLYKKLDEKTGTQPFPQTDFAMTQEVQALQSKLTEIEEKLSQLKNQDHSSEITPIDFPPPPPEIERLRLFYSSVNPKNSYLSTDEGGEYVLYSDNTVALREGEFHKVNELKGWKDNGVLHMFHPEIDGKMYVNYDNLPSGYYEAMKLKSRAAVKKSGEKRYTLLEKGCITMKRQ